VAGVIRINIYPLGLTNVALGQPKDEGESERLWKLYRTLRPQIEALKEAARREGPRVALAGAGGGR
jgi:hypothetical protein